MIIHKRPKKSGEIKRVITNDVDGVFKIFANTLENTNFNLDIFYRNIKSVNLIESSKSGMDNITNLAQYDIYNNSIKYLPKKFLITIFHELFHLASSIRGKKIIYSGFCQVNIKNGASIGYGLNEGYSSILDERYFADIVSDKSKFIGNSYFVVKNLVLMIENAVGKENMENWYSTCDLETLTETLAYATDYESTLQFYRCLDNICLYLESRKFHCSKIGVILRSYEYASVYLSRLYLDVIDQAYIRELISDNEYEDFLLDLKKQLQQPMRIGKWFKYQSKTITDDEFNDLVKKVMQKSLKKYA